MIVYKWFLLWLFGYFKYNHASNIQIVAFTWPRLKELYLKTKCTFAPYILNNYSIEFDEDCFCSFFLFSYNNVVHREISSKYTNYVLLSISVNIFC